METQEETDQLQAKSEALPNTDFGENNSFQKEPPKASELNELKKEEIQKYLNKNQINNNQKFYLSGKKTSKNEFYNTTFTSTLKGFISSSHQSSNTFRNSVSPISFGKQQRFKQALTAGGSIPYYDLKDHIKRNDSPYKKGWGFGYSDRRNIEFEKKAALIPSPEKYHSPKQSQFFVPKDPKKCTFGESWDAIKRKCDIENKKVLQYVNFENVNPFSYSPEHNKIKKTIQAYTCSYRYPRPEEIQQKNQPNPGPSKYDVSDKLVRNTRFSSIHAGGYSPRSYLIVSKNPGPGDYSTPPTIGDIQYSRSKQMTSTFASGTGKSWYTNVPSFNGSPRDCALALPNSGEPFTHFGSIRRLKSSTKEIEAIYAKTQPSIKYKRNTVQELEKVRNSLSGNQQVLQIFE